MHRVLALVLGPVVALLVLVSVAAGHESDAPDPTAAHVESFAVSPPSPRASSKNIEVLAHVYPGTGTLGDVYGYRGHAYLASWRGRGCLSKGIRVYNLRNPRAPRLVSTFADAASDATVARTWTEKVIVQHVNTPSFTGDLAAVSFQACFTSDRLNTAVFRGFGLYDVTDPAHPRKLALYNTEPGVNGGSHEIWIEAVGARAYVYTAILRSDLRTGCAVHDFRIIDVSNPAAPTQVGTWSACTALGIPPTYGQGGFQQNFVHSVRTDEQATRAYLSYWDLGTVILDISDPTQPQYLGRTTFEPNEEGDAHSAFITLGGSLLVETHETDAGVPSFWDISDPSNPVKLSEFVPDGYQDDTVHDPKVRGSLAYFSWYSLGVVIADISNPANPRFVAQFVPDSNVVNPDFFCGEPCAEVWGVFVERDYILASDMNSGLWVFRID